MPRKRGEVLTDRERCAVVAVLVAWLGRFGCGADPDVTTALGKLAGVDKRVSVTTSTGGTYGDARAGGSGSDAG